MLKIMLILYALLALNSGAIAAQPPSAGSQMLQFPPPKLPQEVTPKVVVEQAKAQSIPVAESTKILVKSLRVVDSKVYSEAELLAVTGFKPMSELSLFDLRGLAAKISDHFHRNGYFVAQAYLPVQEIKDGTVIIAVIEGEYGKVTLHNKTNLSDNQVYGFLEGLKQGDLIASYPLENRLLHLSDIPGVNVKSTLIPGASMGTSDLIVEVSPDERVTGSLDADNAGNRYTGMNRIGVTANFNEPTGHGDIGTLRALTSGDGLSFVRVAYQTQLAKAKAGVAYSNLDYSLGSDFVNLRANGTAKIASLYGSYSLVRSRNNNFYIQLAYDAKSFQDKVNSTATFENKRVHVVMASLVGDCHDGSGAGAVNSYSLTWSAGNLNIQTPTDQYVDSMTSQSNGDYNKIGFSAMRLQGVTDSLSLSAQISGQLASKNLDVSEKMELGGLYAVRAYPEGESYADQGYVLNLEARMFLPKLTEQFSGQAQLIGFIDAGAVTQNKIPWDVGINHKALSGAGLGLNWTGSSKFVVKGFYAHRIGNEAATSAPDSSGRFWIQAVKYF